MSKTDDNHEILSTLAEWLKQYSGYKFVLSKNREASAVCQFQGLSFLFHVTVVDETKTAYYWIEDSNALEDNK